MLRLALALLCAVLLYGAPGSFAEQPIRIRIGDHPGLGRIVFDWSGRPDYRLEQVGDLVVLRFPGFAAVDLTGARRPLRNVAGIAQGSDGIEIALRPGARIRHLRLKSQVVVDVLDPTAAEPPAVTPVAESGSGERAVVVARPPGTARQRQSAAPPMPAAADVVALPTNPTEAIPATTAPTLIPPAPQVRRPPEALRAAAPATELSPSQLTTRPGPLGAQPTGASAATVPPPRAAAPVGLAVRVLRLPGRGPILAIPFPTNTGAALLRRDGVMLAVFDHPALLDLTALRSDPVFASATATPLPGGIVLHVPLPHPAMLSAQRDGAGWLLEAIGPTGSGDAALPTAARGPTLEADPAAPSSLVLRVAQPGGVVTLADPESGLPLLLGTVREANQAMQVGRRMPELDLPATLLGAAVLARADTVTLRAGRDHFMVSTSGGARLSLDGAITQDPHAAGMTRLFDLPGLPSARPLERLRQQQGAIAAAAPLARLPQRRAAAEALLALGLPQEAQAMLALARLEDPNAISDRPLAALAATAALLAGRLPEAVGLHDPALGSSDELTFWRATLAVARGEARQAAPGLVATLPLLLGYPEGLRARLLPPAALALAEASEATALEHLLRTAGPSLNPDLPRAILAAAEGRTEGRACRLCNGGTVPRPAGAGSCAQERRRIAACQWPDESVAGRAGAGCHPVRLAG